MRRKHTPHLPHRTVVDVDPEDPSNTLVPDAEPVDAPADGTDLTADEDEGENMFEAIERHATEDGASPDHELSPGRRDRA
jgi:hypothetical protein